MDARIAGASREVERVRRLAYQDVSYLPNLVDALCELAKFRSRKGDPGRAERLYREALTHCAESSQPVPPELLYRINSLLAYHFDSQDKASDAILHYERALAIAERCDLLEPIQLAVVHNNLAMLYKKEEDYAKAESSYHSALKIFSGSDTADARIASVHNNLGVLYYSQHAFDRSRECHLQALNIRRRIYGESGSHYDLGQSYNNLAAVHKAMGDYQTASTYFKKVEALGEDLSNYTEEAGLDERGGSTLDVDKEDKF